MPDITSYCSATAVTSIIMLPVTFEIVTTPLLYAVDVMSVPPIVIDTVAPVKVYP